MMTDFCKCHQIADCIKNMLQAPLLMIYCFTAGHFSMRQTRGLWSQTT